MMMMMMMRGLSFSPPPSSYSSSLSSSSSSSSSLSTLNTRERVFTLGDSNNKSAMSSSGVGIDVSKTRMMRRRRRRSLVATTTATTAKAALETAATSGEDVLVVVESPPRTCSEAAIEARNVLRKLREEEEQRQQQQQQQQPSKSIRTTKRLRVELPLPREDKGDDIVWLGLHGQASDWSGGMSERFAKTKVVVETMLSGYEYKYLGLLDKDAEGMGLWTATEDMSVVTMPSDTTRAVRRRRRRHVSSKVPRTVVVVRRARRSFAQAVARRAVQSRNSGDAERQSGATRSGWI